MSLAVSALREGIDVYFFLAGMIALSGLAATQGLYEWLGTLLTRATAASRGREFWSIYAAGAVLTTFLSNDATILLLTPAAISVARRSGASPLPLVYATAFVANGASFVLPISNPANLLLFPKLPGPLQWLGTFGMPSIAALAVTGALTYIFFRRELREPGTEPVPVTLAPAQHVFATLALLLASCAALVAAASLHLSVGVTAAICAIISLSAVTFWQRDAAYLVLRSGQWRIIALVALLLVAVKYAGSFGAVRITRDILAHAGIFPHPLNALAVGGAVAAFSNVANNLPAAALMHYAAPGNAAALIGVDLGPNFALSGSLATLLWVGILRRHGIHVTALQFLKAGAAITIPSLALSLILVR